MAYERLHTISFTCGLCEHGMDHCPINEAARMEAQKGGNLTSLLMTMEGITLVWVGETSLENSRELGD